jgi:hypothetical protein
MDYALHQLALPAIQALNRMGNIKQQLAVTNRVRH